LRIKEQKTHLTLHEHEDDDETIHTISIQFTFSKLTFKQFKKIATGISAETQGKFHHFTRSNRGTQSNQPTNQPTTNQPTTNQPTNQRTKEPTNQPTNRPTERPTDRPTDQPIKE